MFSNLIALIAGILTLSGSFPALIQGTVGPIIGIIVGTILAVGGVIGTGATLAGAWWLERIALQLAGLGWGLIVPASVTFAMGGGSPIRWLILLLLLTCILDVFKRYRRIDWAYLDPTR